MDLIREYSIGINREARNEGLLVIDNESEFHFVGNSTINERDKLRGGKYDLVIIDEAQSQPALIYLIESILEPTLKDKQGTLVISGTGPRIRGTRWGYLWNEIDKISALRLNWNMSVNPYMPDYKSVLETIRKEKGWTEDNPVYVSEYLGKECMDDDALVYRLEEDNYYSSDALTKWINSQPPSDIHFVVGIDYGFEDFTAIAEVAFSSHRPEAFLIYEKKFNRSGVEDIKLALDECVMAMFDKPFSNVPEANKKLIGFADTAGGMKMVSYEMTTKWKYNILPAMKACVATERLSRRISLSCARANRLRENKDPTHIIIDSLLT